MKIRLADYIFKRIPELTGSHHCFLLAGGGAMHLVDALGRSKVTPIPVHHEQAAAIAADAYGRVRNTIGVALVTTGPGGTNAVTGVAGAWMESTPLLMLSGQVSRKNLIAGDHVRQIGFQEADVISIVKSITKYAELVLNPLDIRFHLEKAVFLAKQGRPGPVWLDIPLDIQAAMIEEDGLRGFNPDENRIDVDAEAEIEAKVKLLVEWIQQSKRPLLLGGHGVWLSGGVKEFSALVSSLGMPVQTTWNGMDLIEDAHPLFFGRANSYGPRYPNFVIQNCDLLITIGARLGIQHIGYNFEAFARHAKKIMVDVDRNEIHKRTLKIDLPFHCDAKRFMNKLLQILGASPPNPCREWIEWCSRIKAKYPICGPEYYCDDGFVDAYAFFDQLSDVVPAETLMIPGSSGTGFSTSHQVFRVKKGQRFFTSKGMAAMGYGLPSAIGGCFAAGCNETVTIIGDGGFQLNIQELATIRRHRLPIKIFVFNNAGYLSIRATQKSYFNGLYIGSDAESGVWMPPLEQISRAYELTYRKIANMQQLREELVEVLNTPGPVLCEVMMNPDKVPLPKLGSRKREDGSMESNPLEELVPPLSRRDLAESMLVPIWGEGVDHEQ
jgi:acetolactate synthase-1/2/3 large subunit